MKRIVRYTALLALLIVPLALVACGGDDDDNDGGASNIQGGNRDISTSKGLTLAAVNAGFGNLGNGGDTAESAGDGDLARTGSGAGAPAAYPASGSSAGLGADAAKSSDQSAAQQAASGAGITVSGYGTATAEADSAVIELYFGGNVYGTPIPVPEPGSDGTSSSGVALDAPIREGSSSQINEEALQPVIDALVGAGVSADDIEVIGQGYYDPYYSSATLRASVRDIGILEAAANAATEAANGLDGISLQNTNITYTLTNCADMERAALETAVADAADHAEVLADVLNVGLGSIVAANDYSYPYYYGPFYGAADQDVCASSYYGAIPFYAGADLGGDHTVEVFASVSITYAIQ